MSSVAFEELTQLAALLGYSESQILDELTDLLRARVSFLVRAADFTSETQVDQYLTDLLKRRPTSEELALSRRAQRRRRLTESEIAILEKQQNARCRLCGTFLDLAANPHVDHIVPLAHGGEDSWGNLQLLCGACNLGKHALSSWLLGVPYQSEGRSKRLRYVVLSRAAGVCSREGCDASSANSELELVSRVPLGKGGRWVFDNLRVFCSDHATKLTKERLSDSRELLRPRLRNAPRKLSS